MDVLLENLLKKTAVKKTAEISFLNYQLLFFQFHLFVIIYAVTCKISVIFIKIQK